MRLLDYFRSPRRGSAQKAKDRLQVIIAHGRANRNSPEYFPKLREELLEVIKKYTKASNEDIKMTLEREGSYEILELNVTIPTASDNK